MYQDPGNRLSFGDVIAAPWLFDVVVSDETASVNAAPGKEGATIYTTRPAPPRDKRGQPLEDKPVLAEATTDEQVYAVLGAQADVAASGNAITPGTLRLAVVLTDDCELATLAGDRTESGKSWGARGRILVAGLRKAEDNDFACPGEDAAIPPGQHLPALGTFYLPADAGRDFPASKIDFNWLFAVRTKSLIGPDAPGDHKVVLSLGELERLHLARHFAGHMLRQGPAFTRNAVKKLAQLWSADGNAERLSDLRRTDDWGESAKVDAALALRKMLSETWQLGGPFLDLVDEEVEKAASPDKSIELITESLRSIEGYARQALEAFEAAQGT